MRAEPIPACRRRRARRITGTVAALVCLAAITFSLTPAHSQSTTLRALASARGIEIGAAVANSPLSGDATYRTVLAREFNSVTAENAMKWDATEPSPGQFNFGNADAIVNFARQNNQSIHGHTLVWHSQTPSWVQNLSATEMRSAMQRHITTVMQRYAGVVRTWDVVNEAFNEDGTLRNSFWLQRLGQSYIADAFRFARQADPNARLFINDYNVEGINAKSTGLFNLVRDLRAQGVPIDGVGLQAHLIVGQVPSNIRENIQRFADLGVDVRITELDIRMQLPPDSNKLNQQASDYRRVVEACLAVSRCRAITTWGFTDRYSWVPDTFSGQGAALPFDENYNPKPAYNAMVQALGGTSTSTSSSTSTSTSTSSTTTTTLPGGGGGCQVAYVIQNQWPGGFTANLTISNRGSSAINGWSLVWNFPAGQTISHGWNATYTQSGSQVTARNAPWNGTIPAGGSVSIGFNGTWNGSNPEPSSFTLNGTACAVV